MHAQFWEGKIAGTFFARTMGKRMRIAAIFEMRADGDAAVQVIAKHA